MIWRNRSTSFIPFFNGVCLETFFLVRKKNYSEKFKININVFAIASKKDQTSNLMSSKLLKAFT